MNHDIDKIFLRLTKSTNKSKQPTKNDEMWFNCQSMVSCIKLPNTFIMVSTTGNRIFDLDSQNEITSYWIIFVERKMIDKA